MSQSKQNKSELSQRNRATPIMATRKGCVIRQTHSPGGSTVGKVCFLRLLRCKSVAINVSVGGIQNIPYILLATTRVVNHHNGVIHYISSFSSGLRKPHRSVWLWLLVICRTSGCTVASGVVGVGVVVVGVCNRSQMRTSKCPCLIFGVSIGLDPG